MKHDPIVESDKIDKRLSKVNGLQANIADLATYGKHSRRLIRWVMASLIFDIILTIILVIIVDRVNSNSRHIDQNRTLAIADCHASNDFRATELKLWNYILSIPQPSNLSAEQKALQQKQLTNFRVYINQAFAQKPC